MDKLLIFHLIIVQMVDIPCYLYISSHLHKIMFLLFALANKYGLFSFVGLYYWCLCFWFRTLIWLCLALQFYIFPFLHIASLIQKSKIFKRCVSKKTLNNVINVFNNLLYLTYYNSKYFYFCVGYYMVQRLVPNKFII